MAVGRWTKEEDRYLMDNYLTMTYKEVGSNIGRKPKSVSQRVITLGLTRKSQRIQSTTPFPNKHKIHGIWKFMKKRCLDPTDSDYARYGGRNITICDEWLENFNTFYQWAISNGYQPKLQMDRINNDGNYEPSNCRFVTAAQNIHNSKVSKLTMHQVRLLRAMYDSVDIKLRELADIFCITLGNCSHIVTRRNWTSIK